MNEDVVATKWTYAGLFLVTLATLMDEILLTRIFSVTMWYHFAFVAISIAMFGMATGAILVHLFPRYFTQARAKYHLALSATLFPIAIVVSFLTHLSVPFVAYASIAGLYAIALTYTVLSVPFVLSGVCVCLALTRFPRQVSRLYAADLAGAALGCILVIAALKITDGPTAVIAVACLAAVAAVCFGADSGAGNVKRLAVGCSLLLAAFASVHTLLVNRQHALLRLMWVKGSIETRPLYEKWNTFSRFRIDGDPREPELPFGWGLSSTYATGRKVRQLALTIDASAGTMLTAFDGRLDDLDFLKFDVVNLAHYLRHDARVLAIGAGGGRDLLSALVFGQKSVVGVEINGGIIDAVNGRFGDFTGHLDRNPKVTFVDDEARSWVARSGDRFDIIQVSLIDTWAATAAGAFVFTENALYTVEAWETLSEHLTPDGIMTFSRWYFRDSPGEVYRLTSLAVATLNELGIRDPRRHIIIVKNTQSYRVAGPQGIGTILVSKEPFSNRDVDTIEQVASRMKFDVVLSPRFALDSTFAALASGRDLEGFTSRFPINIAAPTDDSPFFFHMLRLRDIFRSNLWNQGTGSLNMRAVFLLGALLITVAVLTALCIIVPLMLRTERGDLAGAWPLLIFFAGIGLGFMLVEISQMQRLIVFLGHPTYGLSVVLFSLLLSSGLGSYSTDRIGNAARAGSSLVRLGLLLGALMIFGGVTPYAIRAFQASTTPVRILVAIGLLCPLGLFMGMPFPIGMKLASPKGASLTAWLWGINGATSVCASVLAVVIALNWGITVAFWSGFGCYAIVSAVSVWATRRQTAAEGAIGGGLAG